MSASERLKQARKAAGYDTAVAAAAALGLPEQTYLPYESGRTGFSRRAARLAHFFGVNLTWLIEGSGPMKRAQKEPLLDKFERLPPDKQTQILDMIDYFSSRPEPKK
jgi:transcriptional regulator with XRE-family HTH domain